MSCAFWIRRRSRPYTTEWRRTPTTLAASSCTSGGSRPRHSPRPLTGPLPLGHPVCPQGVRKRPECRVHDLPREVIVTRPKMPVGVERDDGRCVAEPGLYDLHRRTARDQCARVEVPQGVSVDVQRNRLAMGTNLGRGVLPRLGFNLGGTRPDGPLCPVGERLVCGECEQWAVAWIRGQVRRQLVNNDLTERHSSGALERLHRSNLTGWESLPLHLHPPGVPLHLN